MQLISPYQAEYYQKRLQKYNPWYFLVVAAICALVAVWALRQNNLEMIRLRNNVAIVDQQDGDVEAALKELRQYVYAHMNTNLNSGITAIKPPIQLKYRYERLVAAEKARTSAEAARIYTEAQTTCEAQFPDSFSGGPRVPCIENYVSSRQVEPRPVPDSLYKFDFVSPAWSPDLAGFSILLAGLFSLIFILGRSLQHWLKSQQAK